MAIIGDGRGGVFCENSLDNRENWGFSTQEAINLGAFDVVLTNPPFGKKLKIYDQMVLQNYSLGYKWKKKSKTGSYTRTSKIRDSQSPQILFVERCLALLKEGGRLGIIVPESMFCNPSHRYIIQYIKSVARIVAIVSFPEELFQPFTHAKAVGVIIEKTPTRSDDGHDIFMALAKWCGHDSRGLPVPTDDIPSIAHNYRSFVQQTTKEYTHLGFSIGESAIVDNIYLPKYYNPEIRRKLDSLRSTHHIVALGTLIDDSMVTLSTGHEVGKLAYGTGQIPFVRTSDIANWEIKLDPKHGLSSDIYEKYRVRQDVRAGDILMVRDGTYLVGTCAIVSDEASVIVFQSHIYKLRCEDHGEMHPYLLLALLSSPVVREQIYAKRFTQDIIDTLGGRIRELKLPVPKDDNARLDIIDKVAEALRMKSKARALARSATLEVARLEGEDQSQFLTLQR